MGWIRLGECKQCGKCCHLKELLKASVLLTTSVSDKDATCKHLIELEDGTAICAIFDSPDRPLACIDHPSSPASLTDEDCGYFFIFTDS